MRRLLVALIGLLPSFGWAQAPAQWVFEAPSVVLRGIPFALTVTARDSSGQVLKGFSAKVRLEGLHGLSEARFENGQLRLPKAVLAHAGRQRIRIMGPDFEASHVVRVIPGVLSVLPPLVAILLALLSREVIIALVAGIWLGAVFLFDYDPIGGLYRVLDHFVLKALSESSHLQIILFSMLFGGMVGVIARNGGTRGIASLITRYARTARGGQIAAWLMALVIFFDDYANVLVRGNLMRPITDRLRISREKLSFLVDTGAATVASIFLISTWIGYEVGLIEQGLKLIQWPEEAYAVFIQTIPYRFYPIFALILALLVALLGRDIGPMLEAERRARATGQVLRPGSRPATDLTESTSPIDDGSRPARWYNGLLPILAVLLVGGYGLYTTGMEALRNQGASSYTIGAIISHSDSYRALLWASLSGSLVAILLSVLQRILSLKEALEAWFGGLKAMLLAMLILVLAWSIGAVTEELHTAHYLVDLLRGAIAPHWLPVLVFLTAAAISFATGTSWGTMAIMMPLVIPLAHTLSLDAGLTLSEQTLILHGVISSVLAGAVFGDHCSPISDTTILSSMSSACDHIDHVKTQLPYALLAAAVGMLLGDIPTAFGLSPWISIALGTGVLMAFLYLFGRSPER
ncbi:MAG: Na+/H+ antiporter NhaC family protein [Bacteroidota bacterium]|nr:Na+/H+ antiporter NhaC family protein [Rhodothermia bacterium]MDW8284924.1 Na+/H+ antiporter NhaC family protein [Bacteroidota bacterium]